MLDSRPRLTEADVESGDPPLQGPASTREELFVSLLSASHSSIYGFLVSLVGNRDSADDLMQELSLLLWRKFDAFDRNQPEPRTGFLKWSLTCARNLVRDYYRFKKSNSLVFNDELVLKMAVDRCASDELLGIRRAALRSCLKRLSACDRELLKMSYGQQRTLKDVALDLGKSTNALYVALTRVRRRLFTCINKTLGLEE